MSVWDVVKLRQNATLSRMVWIGLTKKMTFKQILEGGEGLT